MHGGDIGYIQSPGKKNEGKRSIVSLRGKREVSVKNYLTQLVHECVDGIQLVQTRASVGFCEKGNEISI
jgi:hypothetical protein